MAAVTDGFDEGAAGKTELRRGVERFGLAALEVHRHGSIALRAGAVAYLDEQ